MRIAVDTDRCDGYAVCESVAPGVLKVNADEVAQVIVDPVPEALCRDAEEAVQACPKQALRIYDDEEKD